MDLEIEGNFNGVVTIREEIFYLNWLQSFLSFQKEFPMLLSHHG